MDNVSNSSFFNLAISRAQNLSKRAGIGWALIGGGKQLLHHDACMAGLDGGKLESSIKLYSQHTSELFISSEPTPATYDIENLILSIEESSISSINIGKNFSDSITNDIWRNWLADWHGSTLELPNNPITEKLSLGIELLHEAGRPWVTSITAADFFGHSQSLVNFVKEFDFLNYLTLLVKQSRAVLISPNQRDIVNFLPTKNFVNESIEYFEITNENNIASIYQQCVNEFRCSVIMLTDIPLLAALLNQHLVDEVVHHLTNSSDLYEQHKGKQSDRACESLNLECWTLLSSSVVGKCNRMIYGKSQHYQRQHPASGRGFN